MTQKANPRAFPLPTDPAERKEISITRGVLDYFPNALAEVAKVSKAGNDQHNPGQPLHWARGKSTDQADCIARHLIGRGSFDTDGQRHSAKLAWRALALLQEELEAEQYGQEAIIDSVPANSIPQRPGPTYQQAYGTMRAQEPLSRGGECVYCGVDTVCRPHEFDCAWVKLNESSFSKPL